MQRPRRQHATAVFVIALVGVIFGCGFATMKIVLNGGMSVGALISLRFVLGSLLMLPLMFWRRVRFDRQSARDGAIIGLVLVSIFWLQTDGLRFTTSAKSGLISSLYLPLTPLLAFFLRDRVKLSHALAALLATFGLYLLIHVPGSFTSGWNRGDVETLACAVLCAVQVTLVSRWARRSEPWILAFMQLAVTGGISLVITSVLPGANGFHGTLAALHRPAVFGAMTFMILLNTIFCFWGMSTMQSFLSATEAVVIYSLEPVVAALVGVFWMGERFLPTQIAGVVVIVVAMISAEVLPRVVGRLRPAELAEAD